jgi:hypothetical protein
MQTRGVVKHKARPVTAPEILLLILIIAPALAQFPECASGTATRRLPIVLPRFGVAKDA